MLSYDSKDLIYDWNHSGFSFSSDEKVQFCEQVFLSPAISSLDNKITLEEKFKILELTQELAIESIGLNGEEDWENNLELLAKISSEKWAIQPIFKISCNLEKMGLLCKRLNKLNLSARLDLEVPKNFLNDASLLTLLEETISLGQNKGFEVALVLENVFQYSPKMIHRIYEISNNESIKGLVLSDSKSQATPMGIYNLVTFIKQLMQGEEKTIELSWYGASAKGLAIANAMSAHMAGVSRIYGACLGEGEIKGRTPMEILLVNFYLMGDKATGRSLTKLKDYVELISNCFKIPVPHNYPVFGKDAFETATGVHAAAVIKAFRKKDDWLANRVYSGVPADVFGLKQKIRIGPMSGKSNVIFWLEHHQIEPAEKMVESIFHLAKTSNKLLTDEEIYSEIKKNKGV